MSATAQIAPESPGPVPPSLRDMLDERHIVGEPRTANRRFWTTREIRVLKENYPAVGLAGCLPLLPGRTAGSIYQHANAVNLVAPREKERQRGLPRQAWTTSDHIDTAIRRGIAQATNRGDVLSLAKAINRPRWWVSKLAQALGLIPPRFKQPEWAGAELEIISNAAHLKPAALKRRLQNAGFDRTETAIVNKLKRVGADRQDPDHCSAFTLSTLMGVDGHTITDWIAKGWLIAGRRGTNRVAEQGGDSHWIRYADVRRFITTHAAHVDIRKVDKFWFIDLLAGPYRS
jgi:hypothetical protein